MPLRPCANGAMPLCDRSIEVAYSPARRLGALALQVLRERRPPVGEQRVLQQVVMAAQLEPVGCRRCVHRLRRPGAEVE
eukprot:658214-Prymnesium_polylepis.1